MITYKAIEAIEPFFKEGEQLTLGEWMNRLNLDEPTFMRMVTACGGKRYFVECNSEIKIEFAENNFTKYKYFTIGRENMHLTDSEKAIIEIEVQKILDTLNK